MIAHSTRATYTVIVGATSLISGPYSAHVIKDDGTERKIVSSTSDIQSAERANQCALDYCDQFGATLEWPLIEVAS